MEQPNADLNGAAPDHCAAALLLVDVINPLDFPEADQLLPHAEGMAAKLKDLKACCKSLGIPVIYSNDNFGRWRSDFRAILGECEKPGCRGRFLIEALRPDEDDYFVLKPKHSAFYSTALDLLLKHLGTRTLIIGGIAGNICVLFTANEAYMRDFKIVVPRDCVSSNTPADNEAAVEEMRRVLKAEVRPAELWTDAELRKLLAER
jgi:nicotinamidase-related amidase